jgi:hypothetical protein
VSAVTRLSKTHGLKVAEGKRFGAGNVVVTMSIGAARAPPGLFEVA